MPLQRISVGTRVRRFIGGVCRHGIVQDVAFLGPWVRVLWDGEQVAVPLLAGELQAALPADHTHACLECGEPYLCTRGDECPEPATAGHCSEKCASVEIPF